MDHYNNATTMSSNFSRPRIWLQVPCLRDNQVLVSFLASIPQTQHQMPFWAKGRVSVLVTRIRRVAESRPIVIQNAHGFQKSHFKSTVWSLDCGRFRPVQRRCPTASHSPRHLTFRYILHDSRVVGYGEDSDSNSRRHESVD